MNIYGSSSRFAVLGFAVSVVPAFAAVQRDDDSHRQTKTVKLTASQAKKVMDVLHHENYSLADAVDKANDECEGTPIAAESCMVSESEFKRTFAKDDSDRGSNRQHSDSKVVLHVAYAFPERSGVEVVAVCPETDESTRLAAAFGRQGFGQQVRFQNDEAYRDDERAPYGQSNRSRYDDDQATDRWNQDADDDNGNDDTRPRDRYQDNWREDQNRDRARDNRFGRNERWFHDDNRNLQRLGIFKGTKIIGADVENHDGNDLGTIEDIAIDPRTGRIKYVVLQSGGFMGIGGKYFAVPWQALQPRGQEYFIASIDEQTLERLPGFDDDNWPPSANTRLFRQQGRDFDEQQAGRFDQFDAERRGFLTEPQIRQTGTMNIQPAQARTFAQVLDQNDFTLREAIQKGEQHTNGKAVAAKCAFASRGHTTGFQPRGQFENPDRQIDWDTQTEYSVADQNPRPGPTTQTTSYRGSDVVVEVTCLKKGQTGRATVVVISPATGEVVTTREETLSLAHRTSAPGNM